jgi:hypothetical protein
MAKNDSRIAISSLGVRSVGDIRGIEIRREVSKAFSCDTRVASSKGVLSFIGGIIAPETSDCPERKNVKYELYYQQ